MIVKVKIRLKNILDGKRLRSIGNYMYIGVGIGSWGCEGR